MNKLIEISKKIVEHLPSTEFLLRVLIEFLYPLLIFFGVLALLDNSTSLYWKIVTVIVLLVCPFIAHFSISYLCNKDNTDMK